MHSTKNVTNVNVRLPLDGEADQRYIFTHDISCASSPDAHYVNITFQNQKLQKKSIRMDIGVIYGKQP